MGMKNERQIGETFLKKEERNMPNFCTGFPGCSLHWFFRMKGKEINGKSSEKNEKRGWGELS